MNDNKEYKKLKNLIIRLFRKKKRRSSKRKNNQFRKTNPLNKEKPLDKKDIYPLINYIYLFSKSFIKNISFHKTNSTIS